MSVISTAEFEALVAPTAPQTAALRPAPRPTPVATPPSADPTPEPLDTAPPPLPPAETRVEPPAEPPVDAPAEDVAVLEPELAPEAVPRPQERVAPRPVAPTDPETPAEEVPQEAVTPEPSPEPPARVQEAAAPEAANTQIVTEPVANLAPARSLRPPGQVPQRPASQDLSQDSSQDSGTDEVVAAVLRDVLGDTEATSTEPEVAANAGTPAPRGPPLSVGEKDALVVAVAACWNVGTLSSEALATKVDVAVEMTEDGRPVIGSIRIAEFSGGSELAARQAFEAARRAIIRCGINGYDLPAEKFAHWRETVITFNPENMGRR